MKKLASVSFCFTSGLSLSILSGLIGVVSLAISLFSCTVGFAERGPCSILTGFNISRADEIALRRKNGLVTDTTSSTVYLPLINYRASLSPFGVQMLGGQYNPDVIALAQQAGIRWVRIYLSWANIEPTNTSPTNYNWGGYGAMFANLINAGMTPIVTIEGNPSWASSRSNGPIYPDKLDDFAEFVGAVVEQFDGDDVYADPDHAPPPEVAVKYWEFYNEPDDWPHWGGHGKEYADMLKVAYPAVQNADPGAKVLLGGLAYDWWSSCYPRCFDLDFLHDVLSNARGPDFPYFDILNFHYYRRFSRNWNPPNIVGKAIGTGIQEPSIKEILVSHGLSNIPFMCTEIGDPYEPFPDYSHEEASQYIIKGFVRGISLMNRPDYPMQALIWFTMVEYHDGSRKFGLLDSNLNPNPEYYAYKTLTAELAGYSYAFKLTGTVGLEGHVFCNQGGMGEKIVLWATENAVPISFLGSQLRVVDKFGTELMIDDGGIGDLDGIANGLIKIEVSQSPVNVKANP